MLTNGRTAGRERRRRRRQRASCGLAGGHGSLLVGRRSSRGTWPAAAGPVHRRARSSASNVSSSSSFGEFCENAARSSVASAGATTTAALGDSLASTTPTAAWRAKHSASCAGSAEDVPALPSNPWKNPLPSTAQGLYAVHTCSSAGAVIIVGVVPGEAQRPLRVLASRARGEPAASARAHRLLRPAPDEPSARYATSVLVVRRRRIFQRAPTPRAGGHAGRRRAPGRAKESRASRGLGSSRDAMRRRAERRTSRRVCEHPRSRAGRSCFSAREPRRATCTPRVGGTSSFISTFHSAASARRGMRRTCELGTADGTRWILTRWGVYPPSRVTTSRRVEPRRPNSRSSCRHRGHYAGPTSPEAEVVLASSFAPSGATAKKCRGARRRLGARTPSGANRPRQLAPGGAVDGAAIDSDHVGIVVPRRDPPVSSSPQGVGSFKRLAREGKGGHRQGCAPGGSR